MRRFRVTLEYDGSRFHGWQLQDEARTVEGCLRDAVEAVCGSEFDTHGASRTDTGVHALAQTVLVEAATDLEPERLARALNALTPEDLGVRSVAVAPPDFHPRFAALEKRYLYRVTRGPHPPVFGRDYQWWWRGKLNVQAMNDAAARVVGRHDFAGFRNRSKDEPEDTIREIRCSEWREQGADLFYQVVGTGFLYKMVRNLVGTFLEVGRGRFAPEQVDEILGHGDRRTSGPTAPPQGLYLMQIVYPGDSPCELDEAPPRW